MHTSASPALRPLALSLLAVSLLSGCTKTTPVSESKVTPGSFEVPDALKVKDLKCGSYAMSIKSSDLSSEDDYAATGRALSATHQNTYGYSATTEDYAPDAPATSHLGKMILAAANGGIDVFAVVSERHLDANPNFLDTRKVTWTDIHPSYGDEGTYFFDAGNGLCDTDGDGVDDTAVDGITCFNSSAAETRDKWLDVWVKTAESLSRFSMQPAFANLKGWTINDFGQYVCALHKVGTDQEDSCYSRAQLFLIEQRGRNCTGCNPSFVFMPTMYMNAPEVGAFIAPGYEVGQIYGTHSAVGDLMAVRFTINLPEAPTSFRLSFLYVDGCSALAPSCVYLDPCSTLYQAKIYTTVTVNDHTWLDEDVWGDKEVELFNEDISKDMIAGTNVVTIGLKVKNVETGFLQFLTSRLLDIWDVKMVWNGEDTHLGLAHVDYLDPDGAGIDYYAGENAAYRVQDVLDGILAPQPVESTWYNAATYRRSVKALKDAMPDSNNVFVVNYGMLWGKSILGNTLVKQIHDNANHGAGTLIWQYPLAMTKTDEGIFKEKTSAVAGFDKEMFWPSRTTGWEGFYQRWTSDKALTGDQAFGFQDTNTSTSGGGYWVKKLSDTLGNVYYLDDALGVECDAATPSMACPGMGPGVTCTVTCSGAKEVVTVALGTTPRTLVVDVTETAPIGDSFTAVNVAFPPKATFTFESGVSNLKILPLRTKVSEAFDTLW